MKKKLTIISLIICMMLCNVYPCLIAAVPPRLGITSPSSGTVEVGGTIKYTVNIYNATDVTLEASDVKISGVSADISIEGSGNSQRIIVLSNIQGSIGSVGYISYISGGVAKNEVGESREMNITSTSFTIVATYEKPEEIIYLKGDANQDGHVTKEDADYINYLYENGIKIDDELLKICDMDGNGKITPYDAFLINIMLEENQKIGDINGDGQITKEDGILLAEHFLNDELTDNDKRLGDANRDGILNIKDAQEIYYMVDSNFMVSDINKDNTISMLDVNYILRKLNDNSFTTEDIIYGDYNGDGIINQFEIDIIIEYLQYLEPTGDVNRDGAVNSIDASLVMDKYKNNNVYNDDLNRADMNGDKTLNSIDASMIIDIYKNNE